MNKTVIFMISIISLLNIQNVFASESSMVTIKADQTTLAALETSATEFTPKDMGLKILSIKDYIKPNRKFFAKFHNTCLHSTQYMQFNSDNHATCIRNSGLLTNIKWY